MAISLSLVAVTVAALLALVPLLLDVVRAWMAGHRNPLHIVFALVWLLLAPLSGWQLSIALAARRIGSK